MFYFVLVKMCVLGQPLGSWLQSLAVQEKENTSLEPADFPKELVYCALRPGWPTKLIDFVAGSVNIQVSPRRVFSALFPED